jgi:enamine deaminase RidA (YjgF/YER057c/UK114 family)
LIIEKLAELGYEYEPAIPFNGTFYTAVRQDNLVFTSGQLPILGNVEIKGRVGTDITVEDAAKAAELCAYNCLRAVGTVADIESISQVVKLLGMVNVAEGFDNTTGVINGASEFLRNVLGDRAGHARSAVGMIIPFGFAVEVEMVVALDG